MTGDTYEKGYAKSRERFERDTAEHEMTVLHDDGLYRHVRFSAPHTYCYGYDLVTWPGHLAICGDMGDWTFSRVRDMFDFFRCEDRRINPNYWSQKLRGDRAGRDISRRYSEDALRSRVIQWFESATGPIDPDDYAREGYFTDLDLSVAQRLGLSRALEEEILNAEDGSHEAGAHQRLRDFEWFYDGSESWEYHPPGTPSVQVGDSWEWDLRDFDGSFLWACWAIVRGIEQYRAATTEPTKVAA